MEWKLDKESMTIKLTDGGAQMNSSDRDLEQPIARMKAAGKHDAIFCMVRDLARDGKTSCYVNGSPIELVNGIVQSLSKRPEMLMLLVMTIKSFLTEEK